MAHDFNPARIDTEAYYEKVLTGKSTNNVTGIKGQSKAVRSKRPEAKAVDRQFGKGGKQK